MEDNPNKADAEVLDLVNGHSAAQGGAPPTDPLAPVDPALGAELLEEINAEPTRKQLRRFLLGVGALSGLSTGALVLELLRTCVENMPVGAYRWLSTLEVACIMAIGIIAIAAASRAEQVIRCENTLLRRAAQWAREAREKVTESGSEVI
jgi:hypothetical protein